jgi:hypothetical protein
VWPLGLEARGGIGKEPAAVQPEAIVLASSGRLDEAAMVAPALRSERNGGRAVVQDDLDAAGAGCPHAEVDAPPRQLGADRQAP